MKRDPIPDLIRQVDVERMRAGLFYLAKDPLPYRKVNHTVPGHAAHTLDEADAYIVSRLEEWGYAVEREACQVQAFRCDRTKPLHHWYSRPPPEDPWYTAYNLYAKLTGTTRPDEIVVVVSHKDSPSWIDSPGAYDNAVGTVGNLEIARVLRDVPTARSIWFLYCNEEHTPWTSVTAARRARERGDDIVAVFNLDSMGGKGQADIDAGRKTNVARYTCPEGKPLADLMAEVNETYAIGLIQSAYHSEKPGDDDGSFIQEGYRAAIGNVGSIPYADPNYHLEGDVPERVDMENVTMTVRASLAAILRTAGYLER
jgi:hypothetical protein